MKNTLIAILTLFTSAVFAQDYKPVDSDAVDSTYYLTNKPADEAISKLVKYLDNYGDFVKINDKVNGNIRSLEFVTTNQNDAARSTKLKANFLVKDGKIAEMELNGYVGHVVNLFKGYWQTDMNYTFTEAGSLYRKYGTDYIVVRTYGKGSNFGRILVTDKPKKLKAS